MAEFVRGLDSGEIARGEESNSESAGMNKGSSPFLRCVELGCRREAAKDLDGFCELHSGRNASLTDDGDAALANLQEVAEKIRAKTDIISTATEVSSPSSSSSSSSSKKCVVRGCSNLEINGRNFCAIHDNSVSRRFQRTIESGDKKKKSQNGLGYTYTSSVKYRCKFEGCVNKSVRGGEKGYCRTHGGGKRCHYGGCTKSAKEGGLCIAHGGGKRCIHSRCLKGAKSGEFCITHSHLSDEKKEEIKLNAGNAHTKRAQKVVLAEQRLEAKRLKLERAEKIKLQKVEKQARAGSDIVRKGDSRDDMEKESKSSRTRVDPMGLATPPFANLRAARKEAPTSSETIISLLGAANTLGGEGDPDGEDVRPMKRLRHNALFANDEKEQQGGDNSSSNDVASMLLSLHGK